MKLKHIILIPVFVAITFIVIILSCGKDNGGTQPPPPATTTSGGMATINTGDTVIGFIPVGTGVIIIPLSGKGSQQTQSISLKPQAQTKLTLSFTVDSCTADGADLKVVCVGYDTSKIAIIDVSQYIASGATPTVTEVNPGNTVYGSFSGDDCINCGVLADQGDHRFIVSAGDGYRVFDYTGKLLKSYLSNSTMSLATENFSFDPVKNRIISPEYETPNNYLWVISLDNDKAYRWTKRMVDTTEDSANGLTGLPAYTTITADAASIDFNTGILTIGHEWEPMIIAINLNAATFNDSAGTFDAPYSIVPLSNVYSPGYELTTGMAIEPSSHLLFLEEEFGDAMGLVVLPSSSGSGAPSITEYTTAQIPDPSSVCTNVYGWYNVGDPHGLALFTGVVDGKPKGLLINDDKSCLAIVDLDGFRKAPKQSGTNQVDPTYNLVTNGVVQFISLQ